MGAFVGLLFAAGVLVALSAWTVTDRLPQPRKTKPTLRREHLVNIGCAFASLLFAYAVTALAVLAVFAAIAGWRVPTMWRNRRAAATRRERRGAWPEVIDSLVSAIRAGLSLPEAVCALADRGPVCLRADFENFASNYRATGNFEDSLEQLRKDVADPIADRILEALLVAREVGGTDLGVTLRSLAQFVREDLRLRGEAEARRSWTVNGSRLAVCAPWIVLLMLSTRPGTVAAYSTFAGTVVLTVTAALSVVAYKLMTAIGRLPEEGRIVT